MFYHILIDADDTLLDFQKAQLISFQNVLNDLNVKFTQKLYEHYNQINHKFWHCFEIGQMSKVDVQRNRFTIFFQEIGLDIDGEIADGKYQDSLEMQSWLIPYALDVCKQLAENHRITVITNGVGKTQVKRLTSSLLKPYISNIVISEDVGFSKPDKRFFEYVLRLLDFPNKEEIIVIGDSLISDIQGAKNIGVSSCWYNPLKCPNLSAVKSNYEISDLRELFNILK